jgi:transglutaminase-like putative cysteine protease
MESDQHILPGLRTVELTCEVTISGTPERAKGLRAWVPFPVTGRYQRVIEPTMESPTSYRPVIHYDARYNTPMLYLGADGPELPKELKMTYTVRVERGRVERDELKAGAMESEEVVRERFAADLVQGSGASAEEMGKIAAGATAGDNAPLSRARKIYDYVVNTVELDSAGHLLSAAGDNATLAAGSVSDNGTLSRTSRYALDVLTTRKGSAADYATATVMLMRAAGIPAHVETGILLGEDKTPDRTAASENGAWVRFYVNGRGWSACDPYLAKRYPELREAMFGGLSSNRVEMSAGPEPELAPAPAGGQPVLFFAPVAEADGKPVFISMKLSFRDIPGGK